MITVIEGAKASGKTTLARSIANILAPGNGLYIQGCGIDHPFWTQSVLSTTKVLIIDDVSRFNLDEVKARFQKESLTVVKQYQASFEIPMPHVIIVVS